MEEHPGISNKGDPALDPREKRERQLPGSGERMVTAEMSPSWSCGFMKRTTDTVKLTRTRLEA